jgi:hypothetical protein
MIEVLDEVARRAGFTWRESYSIFYDPEKYGKSWTDLLKWQVRSYDMSGEWWYMRFLAHQHICDSLSALVVMI